MSHKKINFNEPCLICKKCGECITCGYCDSYGCGRTVESKGDYIS